MKLLALIRRILRGRPASGEGVATVVAPVARESDNALSQPRPPQSVDVLLAEPEQMSPHIERLAELGVREVTFLTTDDFEHEALLDAVQRTRDLGMVPAVRGRGTVLAQGDLIGRLAAQGLDHLEILVLSAISEVHDALAGPGDRRWVLEAVRQARESRLRVTAHLALVPSTWQTADRTLEFLADQGVDEVAVFAICAPDDQASAWVFAESQVAALAAWAEGLAGQRGKPRVRWRPPQRFDPARSLAEQVRGGPRTPNCMATQDPRPKT
jgi:hypothetical protein